jgi:NADPH-dependent 2,4-dienoyl-CoA reductase/sulfur reductase-like enzyme
MLPDIYKNIYIIGGNAAGLAAANQIKRIDPELNVFVLQSGRFISYGSCSMPYYIAGIIPEINNLFSYPVSYFEEKRNIRILLNHKVLSVNTINKEIITDISAEQNVSNTLENSSNTGKIKKFNYDRLIICSGASPVKLNIPGINAANVFYFHNIKDAISLNEFITKKNPKNVLIAGGGYIGLLIADALDRRGIRPTVIEMKKKIFSNYEDEITDILYKIINKKNINIMTGSRLESINTDKLKNISYSVNISSEKSGPDYRSEVDTDLIVIATGVKPNTDFLSGSNIDLGITDAIKVSSKQQTSQPNIYAAGDCSTVKNIVTGLPDYIPTSLNAIKAGRVAGANAAGMDQIFPGSTGTQTEILFGIEFARTGIDMHEAEMLNKNAVKITGTYKSHVASLPGAEDITFVLIIDKSSRELLGAQMAGRTGVSKRIDIFATALAAGMTVDEIYMLDLSYCPPVATVPDAVNRICGKAIIAIDKTL